MAAAAAADGGMHEAYVALAARAVDKLRQLQPGSQVRRRNRCLQLPQKSERLRGVMQLWIAIAGPPGAGKTTLSYAVRDRINQHVSSFCFGSGIAFLEDNSNEKQRMESIIDMWIVFAVHALLR
jgi:hypothetical protein